MGTKKTGNLILKSLSEKDQTLSELELSLEKSGRRIEEAEVIQSLRKLENLGFIVSIGPDPLNGPTYRLTPLGQSVIE